MTAARETCRNRHGGSHARGFTLVEVLLATVLSASLLAVLWSLFSVYLRLFEDAPAQTERVQLARALLEQLSDDLHSAIEDSAIEDSSIEGSRLEHPAAGSPGSAGPAAAVRRFGLLGSRQTLRFDVLQMMPLEESPSLRGDVTDTLRGVTVRQVPELRTIYYTFQPPKLFKDTLFKDAETEAPSVANRQVRPGLLRRELDYETPSAEMDDLSAGSITWAPEVVGLEFRYFDGSGFSSQWNSLKRKSLPVAVEVTMHLRSADEPKPDRPVAEDVERDENRPALADDLEAESKTPTAGRIARKQPPSLIYRLLIDLPSAKRHPAIARAARPRTALPGSTRLTPPGPLAVPRLLTFKRAVSGLVPDEAATGGRAKGPDQWMRTGP